MAGVENVVFDMGGVLMDWNPERIASKLCPDKDDARMVARAVFGSQEWGWVDAGAVSPDTVAWTAHLKLPERLYETADLFALRWHEAFDPLPSIGKLMRELKKEGYGLYLLTNAGPSFDEYRDRIPGIDLFDGVVISCREHLVKPDARIYTLLCDRYQIAPESCLFVDDVEQNVVGAVRVGMSGHLFDGDIDALRDHIHALGPKAQFRRKGPFA